MKWFLPYKIATYVLTHELKPCYIIPIQLRFKLNEFEAQNNQEGITTAYLCKHM